MPRGIPDQCDPSVGDAPGHLRPVRSIDPRHRTTSAIDSITRSGMGKVPGTWALTFNAGTTGPDRGCLAIPHARRSPRWRGACLGAGHEASPFSSCSPAPQLSPRLRRLLVRRLIERRVRVLGSWAPARGCRADEPREQRYGALPRSRVKNRLGDRRGRVRRLPRHEGRRGRLLLPRGSGPPRRAPVAPERRRRVQRPGHGCPRFVGRPSTRGANDLRVEVTCPSNPCAGLD